jgi:hypothetical protein
MAGRSGHPEGDVTMSGILDSRLSLRHLLVVGGLVATFAVSASALAGSFSPSGTFSAGSIRMSSAKSNAYVNVSSTAVEALSTSISVPAGKKAEVQATFSATLAHNIGTYAYCFGAFTLDGATSDASFQPGNVQLIGGGTGAEPDAITVAMTGFRTGIGPGSHSVNVYISPSYAGCTVEDRALNVVVNIH